MRAMIMATGATGGELGRVLGRPVLERALEELVQRGVTRVELILSEAPEAILAQLGEGARWGLELVPHLARSPERAWAVAAALAGEWGDEQLWLGRGDICPRLPELEGEALLVTGSRRRWTGWARLRASRIAWQGWLEAEGREARWREELEAVTAPSFSAASPAARLEANIRAVSEPPPGWAGLARELAPGVAIAPGARVSGAAELIGPVFIGAGAVVEAGARVGPGAVIEAGAWVGAGARVRDAVLSEDTALGEGLELSRAIGEASELIAVDLGVTLDLSDGALLRPLSQPSVLARARAWLPWARQPTPVS